MSFAIVIAGPTASGKSAAAICLAEKWGGEIINADAMQVYQDLRVLTARPSQDECAIVPHHLYGVSAGKEAWSAGEFARRANACIEDVVERGRLPIVVGGTGLWLKALMTGLSPMPPVPPEFVDAAKARLDDIGAEAFHAEVIEQDPAMAHLKINDRQRNMRAWAVYTATGKRLSEWQKVPPKKVNDIDFEAFVLCPDRAHLYQRCNDRFDSMLKQGAVEEVQALLLQNLPPDTPVMKAVGVPELAAHLAGSPIEKEMIAAQQATRRLAKRQMTWFRGQTSEWPHYQAAEDLIMAVEKVLLLRKTAAL